MVSWEGGRGGGGGGGGEEKIGKVVAMSNDHIVKSNSGNTRIEIYNGKILIICDKIIIYVSSKSYFNRIIDSLHILISIKMSMIYSIISIRASRERDNIIFLFIIVSLLKILENFSILLVFSVNMKNIIVLP